MSLRILENYKRRINCTKTTNEIIKQNNTIEDIKCFIYTLSYKLEFFNKILINAQADLDCWPTRFIDLSRVFCKPFARLRLAPHSQFPGFVKAVAGWVVSDLLHAVIKARSSATEARMLTI